MGAPPVRVQASMIQVMGFNSWWTIGDVRRESHHNCYWATEKPSKSCYQHVLILLQNPHHEGFLQGGYFKQNVSLFSLLKNSIWFYALQWCLALNQNFRWKWLFGTKIFLASSVTALVWKITKPKEWRGSIVIESHMMSGKHVQENINGHYMY